ncbi:MAG: HAD family hydrolase [Agathobacter sp.]|nr:HAD family hydrolase [Agathobacter sp.]
MRELEYPFDSAYIIKNKIKLRKRLLNEVNANIKINIAILGGSTTHDIKNILQLFLLNEGICPNFYESEYNKYWEDAMFPNQELDDFKPDLIFIHTSTRNISIKPDVRDKVEDIDKKINEQYKHFADMWLSLYEKYKCPVIQNNFERPLLRKMGNKDISDYRGFSNYVSRLNLMFYNASVQNKWLYINDVEYISAAYGLDKWSDLSAWYMYKYIMAINAIPEFAYNLFTIIKSIYGKNKKVLALDLDNTLWGGVISEDGLSGIDIGEDSAAGEMFGEVQEYAKGLKDIGVLLAINSKNDMENVNLAFSHEDMRVKMEDFSCIKANWENKDDNIISIAETLNLGVDSIVFLDDNPTERAIVKEQLPMVAVPEVATPEQYVKVLDRAGYFEVVNLSEEDVGRAQMYADSMQREQAKEKYTDYGEFLKSLEMKAEIKEFDEASVQRIAQLTNKSNQFNLTTRRYTEEDIRNFMVSDDYICLYGRLKDRFGDNGIVSILIAKKEESSFHIELFLMSCRVLKRDMEQAMMDCLVDKIRELNGEKIYGYYYPTAKNAMVKELYDIMGFMLQEEKDGNKKYCLETNGYKKLNKYIEVV